MYSTTFYTVRVFFRKGTIKFIMGFCSWRRLTIYVINMQSHGLLIFTDRRLIITSCLHTSLLFCFSSASISFLSLICSSSSLWYTALSSLSAVYLILLLMVFCTLSLAWNLDNSILSKLKIRASFPPYFRVPSDCCSYSPRFCPGWSSTTWPAK